MLFLSIAFSLSFLQHPFIQKAKGPSFLQDLVDETLEKIAEAGSRAAAMGLNDEDSEESDSDDDDDDDGSAKRKSKQYHSSGSDDPDDDGSGDYGTMVNLPKKAVHDSEEEVDDDDEDDDDDDDDEGYGTMVQRPKKTSIKSSAKRATIEDSDTDGEDSGTTKFTDPKAPSSAASSGADPLEISDVLSLSFFLIFFVLFLIIRNRNTVFQVLVGRVAPVQAPALAREGQEGRGNPQQVSQDDASR